MSRRTVTSSRSAGSAPSRKAGRQQAEQLKGADPRCYRCHRDKFTKPARSCPVLNFRVLV